MFWAVALVVHRRMNCEVAILGSVEIAHIVFVSRFGRPDPDLGRCCFRFVGKSITLGLAPVA
jgi:hypothetical protein